MCFAGWRVPKIATRALRNLMQCFLFKPSFAPSPKSPPSPLPRFFDDELAEAAVVFVVVAANPFSLLLSAYSPVYLYD
jgi:hypothetical protein